MTKKRTPVQAALDRIFTEMTMPSGEPYRALRSDVMEKALRAVEKTTREERAEIMKRRSTRREVA